MKPSFWDWGLSEEKPFFIRLQTYPAGVQSRYAPDFHEAIHLNVLLEGDLGGTESNRTVAITAPWEPHGGSCCSRNGAVYCMTVTSPVLLKKILLDHWDRFFAFLSHSKAERLQIMEKYSLFSYCHAFADKIRKNGVENEFFCWKAALECFMDIACHLPELEVRPAEKNSFMRLLPALKKVGSGKCVTTAEDAAEACSMSVSRFRTLFKEVFQISFASYELQHRMKCAAEDILYRGLAVKDAAYEWGFFDASHLSRVFKQHFNCTPGQYREKFPDGLK